MTDYTLKTNLCAPDMVPSRDGYGLGLIEAAKRNPNVVALGADITSSTRVDWFSKEFPNNFYEIGIAEQNQVDIAAGMSLMGKVPFACTYGVFLAGRAWDQVRTTVCYNNLNVKLGGAHGGISVGADGATHQALEEISLMRCLPHMKVIVPTDAIEVRKATVAAAETDGPVYIRFGREAVPVITDDAAPFEIGKAYRYRKGSDLSLVACGSMVYECLMAAEILATEGIDAEVINLHTIKPIDIDALCETAAKTGAVLTAEEHQVMGGMGSAVAEVLSQYCPVPMKLIGINDCFGESGEPITLKRAFGLTCEDIAGKARALLENKYKG